MDIFISIFKCLIFYFVISMSYRIMGKREVGELSIMDFIVSIFLAQLASISIENLHDNIFIGLAPIIVLVILQVIFAKVSLKFSKFRDSIDGKLSVIISRGMVNFDEMLKQRYNLDDLLVQLREKGIKSIEEVDYAILETSGRLSIFEKKDDVNSTYPLPIILDGVIQEDTLRQIGRDKNWLMNEISINSYSLENIFYGFYKEDNLYLIEKESVNKTK